MSITADEISRVLALLEKSPFDEIRIDEGDLHIALSRNGVALTEAAPAQPAPAAQAAAAPSAAPSTTPSSAPAAAPANAGQANAGQASAGQADAAQPDASQSDAARSEAGLVEIKAPIVGIFYVSPEPGAEPFVTAGQAIDSETTVGIIEVMKVFNTVPSGISGTIERRLVENGDFVEFGQPIFLVRPDGA